MSVVKGVKTGKMSDRLMVKSEGQTYIIDVTQIDWCEAHGNYVQLHISQECYRVRSTIRQLEQVLPKHDFIRIHRSTLVNLTRVHRLRHTPDGRCDLILRDGTNLRLAKSHRTRLLNSFNHITGVRDHL